MTPPFAAGALDVLTGFSLVPLVPQGPLRPLDGGAGSPAGSVPQPRVLLRVCCSAQADPEQEKPGGAFLALGVPGPEGGTHGPRWDVSPSWVPAERALRAQTELFFLGSCGGTGPHLVRYKAGAAPTALEAARTQRGLQTNPGWQNPSRLI